MVDRTYDLNSGVLAPVAQESTVEDLPVTGDLPQELSGTLIRNGPNPFSGRSTGDDMLSWWVGPAMVHGVAISDGQARWYRNRWIRTGDWSRHFGPDVPIDELANQNPNVSVISHAGRLLALGEGCLPVEIGSLLETVGPTNLGGALIGGSGSGGMTAHPKTDPVTGELFYFRADWQPPYLRYGMLDQAGDHVVDQTIDLPAPAMMHDFAITETRAIFLDLNVAYDFDMLSHGAAIPLRWHEERVARLGIMPRTGGTPVWAEIEPCFIQHVVNAYDHRSDTVVLDAIRYPGFLIFDRATNAYEPNPLGVPWRYTVQLTPDGGSTVTETQLDDRPIELPRIDESRTGRHHRRFYAAEQPTDTEMRNVIALDVDRGSHERHQMPAGDQTSEPVFAPRGPDGDQERVEGDGWILACVYRATTDTTDVVVLDANRISDEPVATIHLPNRIPAGFHGTWFRST